MLRAAERDHDERDLESLEEHALERDGEGVPVDRAGTPRACSAASTLFFEDLFFVVQRLQPAGAQDRLAQPLQTEHQQQRADDESQRVDRESS